MNNNKIIDNTKDFISKIFTNESSGHDYWHTIRVYNNAMIIAKKEKANVFIVEMAALLHDVDDEKLNISTGNNALNFLKSQNLDQETIYNILYIIENQSFRKSIGCNNKLTTIEAKIVQDADRLDAIGAIGIARAFAYGGNKGKEMHNPNKGPAEYINQNEYAKSNNTVINHFYEKLLKLKELMNTETAKKIANDRHNFMVHFLKEFYDEWDGLK